MENETINNNEEDSSSASDTAATTTIAHEPPPIPELTSEQKTFALCTYLLPLLTSSSFIIPLIVWLLKKDEDAYIANHAKQSLNFQITMIISAVVAWLSCFFVIGILLFPAVGITYLIFSIIASIKAYKGEEYKIPFCILFIK